MTPQQLSTQVYEKLVSLNYARKANHFTEANNTWFNELDQEVKDAIRTFPILYVDGRNDLMEIDNLDGNQQFFIFKNDDGFFLVDTQGYNYPRYITELISFDEEDESQAFEYMDGMIRIANDQIFNSVVRNLVSDLNEEGLFDKSDILSFLQFKLDMAFEAATKKL